MLSIFKSWPALGWLSVIAATAVLLPDPAWATRAGWVFAHRANTIPAVRAADADNHVNAVEIDISLRASLPVSHRAMCSETWCAYHSADIWAVNLSAVLNEVHGSNNLHAAWLDVKTLNASDADYANLVTTVRTTLRARNGRRAVRKFWGVYPASKMNSIYVASVLKALRPLGGNSQNVLVFDLASYDEGAGVAAFCADRGMQCGVSAGVATLGGMWARNRKHMVKLDRQILRDGINSTFMWTFNWTGRKEDDLMRLLFQRRDYVEVLAKSERFCGLEGNGVIVGPQSAVYRQGFCRNGDGNDACSFANGAIRSGPNAKGDRTSDIGQARRAYTVTCKR